MSQRALGLRTGLPQSHISQIENGGTDLRITSLLSLAHALDLEFALVPRRLIPAIEGLERGTASPGREQLAAYRLDEDEDDA